MKGLLRKSFDQADEIRPFDKDMGRLEVINLDGAVIGRAVFQPGWKWSEHIKPIAGTDSCESDHLGYMVSGRMHVKMNDGNEEDFQAGDLMVIKPGHDAWVVGDEPVVAIDWAGFANYAKAADARQGAHA